MASTLSDALPRHGSAIDSSMWRTLERGTSEICQQQTPGEVSASKALRTARQPLLSTVWVARRRPSSRAAVAP